MRSCEQLYDILLSFPDFNIPSVLPTGMATTSFRSALLCAAAAHAAVPQGTEFGATFPFTNLAQGTRAWSKVGGGGSSPVDAQGWPSSDCETVVFDARPFPEWQCMSNPQSCVDDPWVWGIPANGTYSFSLSGNATVTAGDDPSSHCTVFNVSFDPSTFTTSGFFTIPPGAPALAELSFFNTQRSASSPPNSGFTNLTIMRPGHAGDGPAVWSPEVVAMLSAPDHVRFMGATGTNNQAGYYGDVGHHYLSWEHRCLPSDAQVPNSLREGCWGLPWEHVVTLSQATGKGAWVNIPVSGTLGLLADGTPNKTTYAYSWASLLKNGNEATGGKGMPSGAPIYLEHSNEVCVFCFFLEPRPAARARYSFPDTTRARAHTPHTHIFCAGGTLASVSTFGTSSQQLMSAM